MNLRKYHPYTNPNAATIGCKRGTGSQSIGAGPQGKRLVVARAKPAVFLARQPAADRATDARRLRLAGLLIFSSFGSGNMTGLSAMGVTPRTLPPDNILVVCNRPIR